LKRRRGFTLIEVTFAASILAVALLGLFSMLTSAVQAAAVAQERGVALRVGQNVLENFRTTCNSTSFQNAFAGVTSRTFTASLGTKGETGYIELKPQQGDPDNLTGFVWFPGDDATKVSAEDKRRKAASRTLLLPAPSNLPWSPTDVATNFPGQLREDVTLLDLGMPRDLNANGSIDTTDIQSSVLLLPIAVVVEWRGVGGNQRLQLQTTIGQR
jgi:prepilin-type N-terminal cleavage/methylation domain-containing protein